MAFLSALERGCEQPPRTDSLVYLARGADTSAVNTLTVILDLDWPREGATVEDDTIPRTAAAAAVFRVKDFLEQRLLVPVELIDIHARCIRVRYSLPEDMDPWTVQGALRALAEVAESFSVLECKANIAGRAIRA